MLDTFEDQPDLPIRPPLDDRTLGTLFEAARTANAFLDHPVPRSLIQRAYDLARMGPTSMNCQPMRLVILDTPQAKERLMPALHPGNVEKTQQAPTTMIVAYDVRFFEHLPRLFPHYPEAAGMFANNSELAEETAFRNGTLQGAYLSFALRAVGLDVGSMSGFDRKRIDADFFPDGRLRSNWLMNVGVGDPSSLFPRGPRLAFNEAAQSL